ncbi:MAG: substrate-binding domain-containing protein [Verrucomicrobiota bacterium]
MRRLGILSNTQNIYGIDLVDGANGFIHEHDLPYIVDVISHPKILEKLNLRSYHGFITSSNNDIIRSLPADIPAISIDSDRYRLGKEGFMINNERIGELAAELFHREGVVSYVYFDGYHDNNDSINRVSSERLKGFRDEYRRSNTPLIPTRLETKKLDRLESLVAWLTSLPKPIGVFCFNDYGSIRIIEGCEVAGLNVPEDVMIVGVDNDPILCSLGSIRLSSIDTGIKRLAYLAAESIVKFIEQGQASSSTVEPVLVTRDSTGHTVASNDKVAETLEIISQLRQPELTAAQISNRVGCSLRTLENLFRSELGMTLQDTIIDSSLKKAKCRLRETNDSIETIASEFGRDPGSLHYAFQRFENLSPGAYRNRFRKPTNTPMPCVLSTPPKPVISLGIICSTSGKSRREIIAGIQHYIKSYTGQQVLHSRCRLELFARQFDAGDFETFEDGSLKQSDGLILVDSATIPEGFAENKPLVTIEHDRSLENSWPVFVDNAKVGALAAKYFIRRGYRKFAYCGYDPLSLKPGLDFANSAHGKRQAGFTDELCQHGITAVQVHHSRISHLELTEAWLTRLDKPTALYVFNDYLAKLIITKAQGLGIRIPQDLAILGTDNDAVYCDCHNFNISSIDIGFRKGGYDMVEFLLQLILEPDKPPAAPPIIQPTQIVERHSTASFGFDDVELERAIRFIKSNYQRNISVNDVVASTTLSRRQLEARSKSLLGLTLLEALHHERTQKIIKLLVTTNDSIKEVASKTGFNNSSKLCRAFKAGVGESPAEFRYSRTLTRA